MYSNVNARRTDTWILTSCASYATVAVHGDVVTAIFSYLRPNSVVVTVDVTVVVDGIAVTVEVPMIVVVEDTVSVHNVSVVVAVDVV